MVAKKENSMKKLYTLSLVALLLGSAVQAMEKPAEKESLNAFIKRMQGERDALIESLGYGLNFTYTPQFENSALSHPNMIIKINKRIWKNGKMITIHAEAPVLFTQMYNQPEKTKDEIEKMAKEQASEMFWNTVKELQFKDCSVISVIAISSLSYKEKQNLIKLFINHGVLPNQKDKDMAALIEYENDPDKFERKYQITVASYGEKGLGVLPVDMIREIAKHLDDPLIPEGTLTRK